MNLIDQKTVLRRAAENSDFFGKFIVKVSRPNPWTDFQRSERKLFLHIPRTAGGSIAKAVPPEQEVGHIPAYVYYFWDPELFSTSYKYAFVRNPWDRIVSAYFRVKSGAKNPLTRQWGLRNLSRFEDFTTFVCALEESSSFRSKVLSYPHFRPQLEFISINGQVSVDFVGRFESLNSDFQKLCDVLDLSDLILPHEHKSNHSEYVDNYNNHTRKIVGSIYRDDTEKYGYSFG